MNDNQSGTRVFIPAGAVSLEGALHVPCAAAGVVIFSHGSGSGRLSPRNQYVASQLRAAGLGTLLLDLLTEDEDRDYELRFDIDLLTQRLGYAVRFVRDEAAAKTAQIGLFGASTGAASALRVAAAMPDGVAAVVSRGGRPDLTGSGALGQVRAPTLLIVGELDTGVIELNRSAQAALLNCESELRIVPGASHLFEERGTLEEVARLSADWFMQHLTSSVGTKD
jgi:putative phosphoribosyl transferase